VALGDSITAGQYVRVPYPELLDSGVLNLGILGSTASYGLEAELPDVTKDCALATIWFGTNDARIGVSAADYERAMRALVAGVRERCPDARIVVATTPNNVPPGAMRDRLAELNGVVRSFRDVTLVDLDADARLHDLTLYRFDRIHPLQPAQAIIAEDFRAKLDAR
jgi:lysophospholipase L1-like esterase